jgi:ParB family chromosome partitioning protein
MKFTKIDIEKDIDWNDIRFCIRYRVEDEANELINSLIKYHMITPPVLKSTQKGRYQILCGFKRLYAAKKIGLNNVYACVYPETLSDEDVVEIIIQNNQGIFQPLEMARLVAIVKSISYDEESFWKIIKRIGDMPQSKKMIEDMLLLDNADDELKQLLYKQIISFEQAVLLIRIKDKDIFKWLIKIISTKIRISYSNLKQIIEIINQVPSYKIIEDTEINRLLDDKDIPLNQKGEQLLSILRKLRYPKITFYQTEFKQLVRKIIKNNKNLNITTNTYFEDSNLNINFKVSSQHELRKILKHLTNSVDSDEMARLFKLLHGDIKPHV